MFSALLIYFVTLTFFAEGKQQKLYTTVRKKDQSLHGIQTILQT